MDGAGARPELYPCGGGRGQRGAGRTNLCHGVAQKNSGEHLEGRPNLNSAKLSFRSGQPSSEKGKPVSKLIVSCFKPLPELSITHKSGVLVEQSRPMKQDPGGNNIVEPTQSAPDDLDARLAVAASRQKTPELGNPAHRLA